MFSGPMGGFEKFIFNLVTIDYSALVLFTQIW